MMEQNRTALDSVMDKLGFEIPQWDLLTIQNMMEVVDAQIDGMHLAFKHRTTVEILGSLMPELQEFLVAKGTLEAMEKEMKSRAAQEATPGPEKKVFETVEQMLTDYGLWVGHLVVHHSEALTEDGHSLDEFLRPELYLTETLDHYDIPYAMQHDFLQRFYHDEIEVSRILQKMD